MVSIREMHISNFTNRKEYGTISRTSRFRMMLIDGFRFTSFVLTLPKLKTFYDVEERLHLIFQALYHNVLSTHWK